MRGWARFGRVLIRKCQVKIPRQAPAGWERQERKEGDGNPGGGVKREEQESARPPHGGECGDGLCVVGPLNGISHLPIEIYTN